MPKSRASDNLRPASQYTVGWICALTIEYGAAEELLDDEHDGPEYVSPQDRTLGRIGKHNVVIAVLPKGQYGLANAATVATNMLHSFPSIRFGLMVGIGGGVPSLGHDIRLGDVVVSVTDKGEGQYDFGKMIQNQRPPRIQETTTHILESNPRLRDEYGRPDEITDIPYSTDFLHDDETCCQGASGDVQSKIRRIPRGEHEDIPAIHYGLIASSNELMKDATIRDRLSREKDVLCFEMEAAGLLNHYHCLVIRGICDYSDTHKNKRWQGYSCMTAAAYAKYLLYRIVPNKVEAEQKLGELIADDKYLKTADTCVVSRELNIVQTALADTKTTMDNLQRATYLDKMKAWLSPLDPSLNLNMALKLPR
ncbi:nucleoside phosphorylase domain-containing protein [Xylariales sp. PMI_506]|nr:nucleoside phosphorylase domain-containing protein [Xylariales sp. PMI_506]